MEVTEKGDHYDPQEKAVRLDIENFNGHSLTAVTVAAHEVGHALQDAEGFAALRARTRLVTLSRITERFGAGILVAAPVIGMITRAPSITALMLLGRLGELSRRQPPLIKEAAERGSFYARASFRVWSYLGLLAADRPEESRREVARGQQSLEGAGYYLQQLLNLLAGASIDIYQGDPLSAWERLDQGWSGLAKSRMLLLQSSRVLANWHRAAAALASARHLGTETSDGRRMLRAAGVATRRVAAVRADWARPVALTLQAALAATRGRTRRALDLLGTAEPLADGVDMSLLSSIIRRRRGELLGGDTGSALISSADLAMGAQGIVNPARLSEVYAPGFSRP